MAQAGMHGMVGMAVRKMTGRKEWLLLGILLGSVIPDMDNVGVAVATVAKLPTEGIHRTMTHSIFFAIAVAVVFYIIGQAKKTERWSNLGFGLGLGILLHSLLDFVLWFNGLEFFWPLGGEINFWANSTPPEWFMKFMDPAEFLFFGLYLWALGTWARKFNTNAEFLKTHRIWMILEFALFAIFTPLVYLMTKGYLTIFGAFYLFSIFMVFFVTIRMRKTVEAAAL
jgi:membrane-bound metal-dependent hydrolase YbcI (DUF457 family)